MEEETSWGSMFIDQLPRDNSEFTRREVVFFCVLDDWDLSFLHMTRSADSSVKYTLLTQPPCFQEVTQI